MEVIKKAQRLLQEKKGMSMISSAVAIIIMLMFLVVIIHYIYLYSMLMGIEEYTQSAVVQTATANSYNVYGGIRESNSSAHRYAGSDMWNEMVSTAEVSTRLKETLNLTKSGNGLYMYKPDGSIKYGLSDIQVTCTNVDIASDNDVTLTFNTTVTAEIPMYFLGVNLDVEKEMSIKSYYMPRF